MTFEEAQALYKSTVPEGCMSWEEHRAVLVGHPKLVEINQAYWLEMHRSFHDRERAEKIRASMDAMFHALSEEQLPVLHAWCKEQESLLRNETVEGALGEARKKMTGVLVDRVPLEVLIEAHSVLRELADQLKERL